MKRRNSRKRKFTEQLRSTSLFCDCSEDELRLAASLMTEVTLAAGCVVVQQSFTGYECFILLTGQAVVERDGVIVGHAVAGSIVGELALMGEISHSATVTAVTDLDVLVMSRTEFAAMRALGTRCIGPRIDAAAAEHRNALDACAAPRPLAGEGVGGRSSRW
jgi:CRP/FNR family transcriptional regulator, cyclic AMP receptor protein